MNLESLRWRTPQPDPQLKSLTGAMRGAIAMAIKDAVMHPVPDSVKIRELCSSLIRAQGGDPDKVVPPGELALHASAGALAVLPPAPPPGLTGYPMWLLVAADARWNAKIVTSPEFQNRRKRRR